MIEWVENKGDVALPVPIGTVVLVQYNCDDIQAHLAGELVAPRIDDAAHFLNEESVSGVRWRRIERYAVVADCPFTFGEWQRHDGRGMPEHIESPAGLVRVKTRGGEEFLLHIRRSEALWVSGCSCGCGTTETPIDIMDYCEVFGAPVCEL